MSEDAEVSRRKNGRYVPCSETRDIRAIPSTFIVGEDMSCSLSPGRSNLPSSATFLLHEMSTKKPLQRAMIWTASLL